MKNIINSFDGEFAFLSNFYESKIVHADMTFPTVEHAFQAAKSLSEEEQAAISIAKTPNIAKRLGRKVILRPDWEQVKEKIMYECVKEKFKDPTLKQKLIDTYPAELIEGNTWHDNCWGDCSCEKCKNIEGKNLLGKILMKVRDEIMSNKKLLIVVDMQNDFIDGVLGTEEAVAIVPNVKAKIEEYKSRGDDIIFTRDTHQENYLETNEGKHLPFPHCIEGTHGWEIANGIDIPDALHINKPTFGWTLWNSHGITATEIEIIGLCTDICVVSNALILKATFPDANITVDASCCAGVTPESHKAALKTMETCQISVINNQ
jgi:ribA/ribD-fused uncharacterized protein